MHNHRDLLSRFGVILNLQIAVFGLTATYKNSVVFLGVLIHHDEILCVHRTIRRRLLQPLCAVFNTLADPGRKEVLWKWKLSPRCWLVVAAGLGNIVVGVACDPEMPAALESSIIGSCQTFVDVLCLLI